MKLLLNEKEYVQKILQGYIDVNDLAYDLNLLVRYLFHEGKTLQETLDYVKTYMDKNLYNESYDNWCKTLKKYYNKASKLPLVDIDYIPVTEKELEIIRSVENEIKEKYLFTLLVLAKYNNMKSENNNGWVNYNDKILIQQSRIGLSKDNMNHMIYELKELGLLTNSMNLTKNNIQVTFIDSTTEVKLKVTILEELGYQYLELKPMTPIRRCIKCGKPYRMKASDKRAGLCPDCKKKSETKEAIIKTCEICGEPFMCSRSSKRSYLCPEHQAEMSRKKHAENVKTLRNKECDDL